jgi:hypothetical protein
MLVETSFDDQIASDFDSACLDHVNFEACRQHLSDLIRVYGAPPPMLQPVSFGRIGPRPPGAVFPQRTILASLDR